MHKIVKFYNYDSFIIKKQVKNIQQVCNFYGNLERESKWKLFLYVIHFPKTKFSELVVSLSAQQSISLCALNLSAELLSGNNKRKKEFFYCHINHCLGREILGTISRALSNLHSQRTDCISTSLARVYCAMKRVSDNHSILTCSLKFRKTLCLYETRCFHKENHEHEREILHKGSCNILYILHFAFFIQKTRNIKEKNLAIYYQLTYPLILV